MLFPARPAAAPDVDEPPAAADEEDESEESAWEGAPVVTTGGRKRAAAAPEAAMPKKKGRHGPSSYTGVDKRNNKWRARIKVDGKMRTIGTFETEIEAARAFQAAREHLVDLCAVLGSFE